MKTDPFDSFTVAFDNRYYWVDYGKDCVRVNYVPLETYKKEIREMVLNKLRQRRVIRGSAALVPVRES